MLKKKEPNSPDYKSENCLFNKFADSVYFVFAYGHFFDY